MNARRLQPKTGIGHCRFSVPGSRFSILFTVILSLSACATRKATVPIDGVSPKFTPAEAVAAIRAHDTQMQTLRARFTATVHSPSQERKARGVVLVKKPDRLRLQLVSPFGLTVMNYTLSGSHARMQLPLEDKTLVDGEIERSSAFSPTAFAPAFLHEHGVSADGCSARDESSIECSQAGNDGRRSLTIGLAPAVVLRETLFRGDTALPLVYSEFRNVDGMDLPFRVTAVDAASATTMQIDIERYEINPVLSDALFDLPGSAP